MRVRDVMTSPVITLRARTPLQAAAALLVAQGFTGTPVVDGDGRVVGIMTEADLMRGQVPPDKSGPGTAVGPTGRCCHDVGSAGDAHRGRLGRCGRDHAQTRTSGPSSTRACSWASSAVAMCCAAWLVPS